MKILMLISWRNLRRNKRRTLVILSSIATGVFAMIFTMGFMNGFSMQMVDNTIGSSIGHAAINFRGFRDDMKPELNFEITEDIVSALNDREVKAWAPRIRIQAMARSSETSRGVVITGIDPEREKGVSRLHEYIIDDGYSSWLQSSASDEVLISKGTAKRLDLMAGDKLVIMLQDSRGEIAGFAMRIAGIYESPMENFDRVMIFTGMEKLQEMTGMNNKISEITILTVSKEAASAAAERIAGKIKNSDLEVLSWKEMAPALVSSIKLFDSMMYVFFMIIFVTIIFSVANTLIMAVMERFHEIGVMKSIGTRPSSIFFLIMFEAANLGILGLAAGVIAGGSLIYGLSVYGIDLSIFAESMRIWGSGSIIYPTVKPMDLAAAFSIVFITTISAALYPAVKAARIKPLDALKHI